MTDKTEILRSISKMVTILCFFWFHWEYPFIHTTSIIMVNEGLFNFQQFGSENDSTSISI